MVFNCYLSVKYQQDRVDFDTTTELSTMSKVIEINDPAELENYRLAWQCVVAANAAGDVLPVARLAAGLLGAFRGRAEAARADRAKRDSYDWHFAFVCANGGIQGGRCPHPHVSAARMGNFFRTDRTESPPLRFWPVFGIFTIHRGIGICSTCAGSIAIVSIKTARKLL